MTDARREFEEALELLVQASRSRERLCVFGAPQVERDEAIDAYDAARVRVLALWTALSQDRNAWRVAYDELAPRYADTAARLAAVEQERGVVDAEVEHVKNLINVAMASAFDAGCEAAQGTEWEKRLRTKGMNEDHDAVNAAVERLIYHAQFGTAAAALLSAPTGRPEDA